MKRNSIQILFVSLFLFGILVVAVQGFHWYLGVGKMVQPIAFSHNLHIEKVGLQCNECHPYANQSASAGIPGNQICMTCHTRVAVNQSEIKKLKALWNKNEPIGWLKVHALPWHVRFVHKRHVRVNIKCTFCHGEIKAMDTVRQVRSLSMGWCVNCHRENNASVDCLTCHK